MQYSRLAHTHKLPIASIEINLTSLPVLLCVNSGKSANQTQIAFQKSLKSSVGLCRKRSF